MILNKGIGVYAKSKINKLHPTIKEIEVIEIIKGKPTKVKQPNYCLKVNDLLLLISRSLFFDPKRKGEYFWIVEDKKKDRFMIDECDITIIRPLSEL